MLSPVLCMLLFKNLQPVPDNFFVRFIKYSYLKPLGVCLRHRWLTVLFFAALFACTAVPVAVSGARVHAGIGGGQPLDSGHGPAEYHARPAGGDLERGPPRSSPLTPRSTTSSTRSGGPTTGPTPTATTTRSSSCPCGPQKDWPAVVEQQGWRRWLYGPSGRARKEELIAEMDAELERKLPGRRLEFLAEHPRQRDGGALRNQRRQLAEDRRPRLQPAPGPRHAGQEHPANRARARGRGVAQHPGAIALGVSSRPGKMPALGRAGRRRKQRRRAAPWEARPSRR